MLVFHTLLTNACSKLKVEYYIDKRLWSKSTIKTPKRCHIVFSFDFEHIQQINLIFSLLTLKMYLAQDKIHKQLKRTLAIRQFL